MEAPAGQKTPAAAGMQKDANIQEIIPLRSDLTA
jgi:hypothetical protein